MIGLELSIGRLWAMRRSVFASVARRMVLTGAVIRQSRLSSKIACPWRWCWARVALSSTAIVMPLRATNRRSSTAAGQTCSRCFCSRIGRLADLVHGRGVGAHDDGSIACLCTAFGRAALAIAVILILGRVVIRPILPLCRQQCQPRDVLAAVLLVDRRYGDRDRACRAVIALGRLPRRAFARRTRSSPSDQAVDIEPFKGLLLGIFFVSVRDGYRPRPGGGKAFGWPRR